MSLLLCNYYGMCDSEGNVLGHPVKVINEYLNLLQGDIDISVISSPCICDTLEHDNIFAKKLPYDIRADLPFTIWKRITDKIKVMRNIRSCMKQDADMLFFLQVDFFFFFYLWMWYRKKKEKRIYCLIYHQKFTGGSLEPVFQYVYRKALRKVDGGFYTQKGVPVSHNNARWIPDYFFDEEIYVKYKSKIRHNQVVCLGTMNRYKQLEQMIDIWDEDYPNLIIAGKFDDDKRFDTLVALSEPKANVSIRNEVLSGDEYYSLLGKSKYSILPYNMEQYNNRTSGVIQESIFLGCIPIAPKKLIEQNAVCGIGYESFNDITVDFLNDNIQSVIEYMTEIIKNFSKEYVKEQFLEMFKKI